MDKIFKFVAGSVFGILGTMAVFLAIYSNARYYLYGTESENVLFPTISPPLVILFLIIAGVGVYFVWKEVYTAYKEIRSGDKL